MAGIGHSIGRAERFQRLLSIVLGNRNTTERMVATKVAMGATSITYDTGAQLDRKSSLMCCPTKMARNK